MKKPLFIIMLLHGTYAYSSLFSKDYILCIDGGGSKTALQVIDAQGNVLPLTRHGVTTDKIEVAGSNVDNVGADGVRSVLHDLIADTIVNNGKRMRDILPTAYVIAGIAGAEIGDNKKVITQLFEELGISKDNVMLTGDAALALGLVPGDGGILIAGTGSICLGQKGNEYFRVGGLGYLLGDEGSGYAMGLQALKVALAYEYGWGQPTSLTAQLCKFYNVPQLKDVMQVIYTDKTKTVQTISRIAPIVVEQALINDDQSVTIVKDIAGQLSDLVAKMVIMGDFFDCEIHLWGGLFKSDAADLFITTIKQHPVIQQRRIKLVNQAWGNVTTLFAQQLLTKEQEAMEKRAN